MFSPQIVTCCNFQIALHFCPRRLVLFWQIVQTLRRFCVISTGPLLFVSVYVYIFLRTSQMDLDWSHELGVVALMRTGQRERTSSSGPGLIT